MMKIESKSKKALLPVLTALTLGFTGACDGSSPLTGGRELNLKGLMVTKILPDNTSVSTNLTWQTVAGTEHYELSRISDNGSEISIGPSRIPADQTSIIDSNLQQDQNYNYVIYAIDNNNKVITKSDLNNLQPITATDLQATTIQNLSPAPALNEINRETTISWSSVSGADLYYVAIINDASSKQVFGMFTKESSISTNENKSPVDPPALIELELPILTGGIANSVKHRLYIYTIKFNNQDINKATAIGLRKSAEVFIII